MMRLFDGLEGLSAPYPRSVVAIGTFDGMHLGHQAVVGLAIQEARKRQIPALIFTFDRNPRELLEPESAPPLLTTPDQRCRIISELGADALIAAHFTRALSELTAEQFISEILKERLGAEAVVVGSNFFFGRQRSGDIAFLQARQEKYGYQLFALEPVMVDGEPASSTRIRDLIKSGEVEAAEKVLGHPFLLEGVVVEGQKLGRKLGFSTANLQQSYRQAVPADGIYAVWVHLEDGRVMPGACSIGVRPTIEGAGRSIETYLLDFDEDLYGQKQALRFIRRLREERKFASLDALIEQMGRDVEQTRVILSSQQETPTAAA